MMKIDTKKMFSKSHVKRALVTLMCLCIGLLMLFPLYMIYINSFKNIFQFTLSPLALPDPWTLRNFKFAIENMDYFPHLASNLIYESAALFFIVLFGSMAGFTIARRPSRIKKIIYIYIVMGITLPMYTALYPQIKLISSLHLTETYVGVIIMYITGGMPMSIFLFNGAFGSMPGDLEDAAKIDGCSYYRLFFSIFFPLAVATSATLVLVQAIGIWNDTTYPPLLITNHQERWSLMVEVNAAMGRMAGQGTRWERLYAIAALSMLPMLFVFFAVNRFLIAGVAEGAIKG